MFQNYSGRKPEPILDVTPEERQFIRSRLRESKSGLEDMPFFSVRLAPFDELEEEDLGRVAQFVIHLVKAGEIPTPTLMTSFQGSLYLVFSCPSGTTEKELIAGQLVMTARVGRKIESVTRELAGEVQ